MTYDEMRDFVSRRMRMSHIYQPMMLMALLKHGGTCSLAHIAKELLRHDQSQLEYYEKITRDMVGRVLRNHGIVSKNGQSYVLNGFSELSNEQVESLIFECQKRLEAYVAQRGAKIWHHRTQSAGYISGTIRYEVLKRAAFRCELCGISAEIKALEVDHIVPRNRGGSDDISNLQSLCYSCNAMKRDRDSTDFREIAASYRNRNVGCLFCEIPTERVLAENELAYAIRDGYPVTDFHTLIIPKRHVADYFALWQPEVNACNQLIQQARHEILSKDGSVQGFNIGMNNGAVSGQTIFHCHIHLIPRREGDVENPRGGVRHVIPDKGAY